MATLRQPWRCCSKSNLWVFAWRSMISASGYSSLSYCIVFLSTPFEIDRSFISGMGEEGEGMEMCATICPWPIIFVSTWLPREWKHSTGCHVEKNCTVICPGILLFQAAVPPEGTAALLAGGLTWQAVEQTK